jgi:hypothetical protein
MTQYPKPPRKLEPNPEVIKRREERKHVLAEVRKRRAAIVKRIRK